MSESPPPEPTPAPELERPGVSGCLGMAIGLSILTVLWLGACLLLFKYLGQGAAAAAFFAPPLAFMLWALFSKPPGGAPKSRA
ncbi:MAG: hypothetical protein M5U26_25320 [Planctomycetota bacterium]|nr:hypothetical protein [Planctomycetota bacterium]